MEGLSRAAQAGLPGIAATCCCSEPGSSISGRCWWWDSACRRSCCRRRTDRQPSVDQSRRCCGAISARPSSRRCWRASPSAAALGFLVAVLIDRVPFLQRGLLPLGNLVSAVPIVGIAPIMVMWFGFDWQSKAAVIVVMTFFPMLINTLPG